jgi:hypothetical protein
MRLTKSFIIIALLFLTTIGCAAKNIIINVDGMPISDKERFATNPRNKMRTVIVLTRYYIDQENEEETAIKPQYLDVFDKNVINKADTHQLILHIKVININKARYSFKFTVEEPDGNKQETIMYEGRLIRRDFAIDLPIEQCGVHKYSVKISGEAPRHGFTLPTVTYEVE